MSLTIQDAMKKACPYTLKVSDDSAAVSAANCIVDNCMAWEWTFRGGKQIRCGDVRAKEEPTRPESVPSDWVFVPYCMSKNIWHAYWEQPPEENRDNWTGYCHLIFRPCGGAE